MATIRTVYASSAALSLADASLDGAILYRMPQNVPLVGYTHVAEYSLGSISSETYNINSSTAQVGSGTGNFC